MRPSILTLLTMVLTLPLSSLDAQSPESENARLQADCRLAAQIIQTGHPAPHTEWAYAAIRLCPDLGPAVLAERWRGEPLSDTLEIRALAAASRVFPRRVVFDAVASGAVKPQVSTYQRVAAMGLLASFAKPGIYLNHRDLMNPIPGRRIGRITLSGDQGSTQAGELGGVAPEVMLVMARIQADAVDPTVRRIACEYVRFLTP
jgi:hypothetical protein